MTTKTTMPFYLWKDEVLRAVERAERLPSRDWAERAQLARCARMYDAGETIESAADTIGAFGQGALDNARLRRARSPLDMAIAVKRR